MSFDIQSPGIVIVCLASLAVMLLVLRTFISVAIGFYMRAKGLDSPSNHSADKDMRTLDSIVWAIALTICATFIALAVVDAFAISNMTPH